MKTGVTSASLIVTLLVAAGVGALVGLGLEGRVNNMKLLAIIAGFVAVIAATIVRYKLIYKLSGAGADDSKIPMVVLVFAVIASIAGSLAAWVLLSTQIEMDSAVWLGTLAGIFSAMLMAMLMITYHMNPSPAR